MVQSLMYREGEMRVIEGLWIFVSQHKQDQRVVPVVGFHGRTLFIPEEKVIFFKAH